MRTDSAIKVLVCDDENEKDVEGVVVTEVLGVEELKEMDCSMAA